MKACVYSLFIGLLVGVTPSGRAAPSGDWRNYKLAVMQTVIEVALPYDRLNELTRTDWQVPYRAPRLESLYSGTGTQRRLFTALLDINGPFWIGGVYGRIDFFGIVNKKPEWFKGDLFDLTALKEMMEHRVGFEEKGTSFVLKSSRSTKCHGCIGSIMTRPPWRRGCGQSGLIVIRDR